MEAVVDPSCWGRAAPAAQNFGWPRRWRIICALRVCSFPFSTASCFFFVSSSQDSICVAERGVAPVLAQGARQDSGRAKSSSTGVVIACGIRTGQPGYRGGRGRCLGLSSAARWLNSIGAIPDDGAQGGRSAKSRVVAVLMRLVCTVLRLDLL